MDRVLDPTLDVGYGTPRVSFVPVPVQRFSGDAELDDEIIAEILWLSLSPRFSRQRRINAASSAPIMIRASDPPMKRRRFGSCDRGFVICSAGLKFIGVPIDSATRSPCLARRLQPTGMAPKPRPNQRDDPSPWDACQAH